MSGISAMRVWWIPQVPGKPFHVAVSGVVEARKLMDTLAKYDQFQFDNRIKGDYANVGGLEVSEEGEWSDWCDEDNGDSVDDLTDERAVEIDAKAVRP